MAVHAKPAARRGSSQRAEGQAASSRARRRRTQRVRQHTEVAPSLDSVQAKLKVGPSDDEYEREADEIADRVMSGSPASGKRKRGGGGCDHCVRRSPTKDDARGGSSEEDDSRGSLDEAALQRQSKDDETMQSVTLQREEEDDAGEQTAQPTFLQPMSDDPEEPSEASSVQPAADEANEESSELQRQVEESDELAQSSPLQRKDEEAADETAQAASSEPAVDEATDEDSTLQRKTDTSPSEEEDLQSKAGGDETTSETEAPVSETASEEGEGSPVQRKPSDQQSNEDEAGEQPDQAVQAAADAEGTAEPAAGEEEDVQPRPRRPSREGKRDAGPSFERRLRDLRRSGGQQLPDALRSFMEPRFGHDLGNVRVHVGNAAANLARNISARAFTVGRDVVFGKGEFRPSTSQGRRLIAHELTHVLQQRGGLHRVQREVAATQPELPERPSLAVLQELFGLAPAAVPPRPLSIMLELLRRALASGDIAAELGALAGDAPEARSTSRTLESADYRLELSTVRTANARQARWTLTDVRTGQVVRSADHTHGDYDSGRVEPSRAHDASRLRLPVAPPPAHRAAEQEGGPQVSDPRLREQVREDVTDQRRDTTSGTSQAAAKPPEGEPIESEALNAANALEPEPESQRQQQTGQQAGSDSPTTPRAPIDEVQSEQPDEEPDAETRDDSTETVQRAPAGPRPLRVASSEVQAATSGPGRPLPAAVLRFMEPRFGAAFRQVRIHDGHGPARVARSLAAKAFTRGKDIVFGAGQYRPRTRSGLRLLAHELSHVLQQRRGGLDLIQRSEECPPVEPVPEIEVVNSPASPGEDPAFQEAKNRTKNRANDQSEHGSGEDKSTSANSAAEVQESEHEQQGQQDQVGEMQAKADSPPAFDKQAFVDKVLLEVEKIAPPTLDSFMKFASNSKAKQVKSAVTGEVSQARDKTQQPLEGAATAEPSGQSPRVATPLEVEPPGAEPASIRADRAMPPPKTASEFDVRPETIKTENILKEACVTREFMDKHDDPILKEGAAAQDELAASTEAAPEQFREGESAVLEQSRAGASNQGNKGVAEMFGAREGKFADVGNTQNKTKSDNEAKRVAAAAAINGLFTQTQSDVRERLTKLETDVGTTFDTEAGAAAEKFESTIRRKAKEYERAWYETAAEWVGLMDPPPPEAKTFYDDAKKVFIADLRSVIENVADLVDEGLKDARDIVTKGKDAVKEKIDSLGTELEDFKSQISEQLNDKFRGLEGEINAKQGDLIKGLAQRYVKALEEAKAVEDKVREEHKNFLEKAEDVYNRVKDAVFGWIEKLASAIGGVASKVIKDPGPFLRNLGAGIIQGFEMFISNIGENIKGAVVQWLTGNLGSAGISLPTSFDTKSIVGFLLELVGLGISNIKDIARKVFGPKAVAMVEKGVAGAEKIKQIFDILATQGPSGLFEYLASEFEEMKSQVMGEAGTAIAEGLVVAGIKKVLGMVSGLVSGGVGTVITIVITIIDVVMWFRSNASQIAELVGTIVGAAKAVLAGQVAALANAVNSTLKRLLPLVLSFVGALVGIDKVIKKIQKIFKAIRKPATKAITALFRKFKGLIDKLLKKFGKKSKKKKKKKKGKTLSPKKVVDKVTAAMKKSPKADDPDAAIAELQSRANTLRSKYQPKLEKGSLTIRLLDTSAKGVEKDDDIDFEVSVNPKKKAAAKVSTTLSKKFTKQISASHRTVRGDIRTAVDQIKAKNITKWASIKAKLENVTPIKGVLSKPVSRAHAYGTHMATPVDAGLSQGGASSANATKEARADLNAGRSHFAKPYGIIKAGVFNDRVSESRITTEVKKAFESSKQAAPKEKYNRKKHYGRTPTSSDRKHFLATNKDAKRFHKKGQAWVLDHDPPLVVRYYQGAPGEKPGWKMTDAERRASGSNRDRMEPQARSESDKQGGEMAALSKKLAKKAGL